MDDAAEHGDPLSAITAHTRPSLSPAGVTEEQVRSAARDLLGALQKYGFPVSLAAEKALRDRGSIEANAVHVAAVGLRAALEAAAKVRSPADAKGDA